MCPDSACGVWCYVGMQLFQGNANTYMSELREVSPPIIGRRLRILPYSTHPKNVCLRVELYGCPWTGCRLSIHA